MTQQDQQWEYCALMMTVVNDPDHPDDAKKIVSEAQLFFYDADETAREISLRQRTPVVRQLGLNGWELVSATSMSISAPEMRSAHGVRDTLFFNAHTCMEEESQSQT